MDDAHAVAVPDGVDNGSDGVGGFFLGVVFFLDDAVEQLRQGFKGKIKLPRPQS